MAKYSRHLTEFYTTLETPAGLPAGVETLYPFSDPAVQKIVRTFFRKYFNDTHKRQLILGINPGRFGAGVTGINFTAPRQLRDSLGISHDLPGQSELSAEFIYRVINAYGGPELFYRRYFIGSISPLGFTKNGINLNYYDDRKLEKALRPFIEENLRKLLSYGFSRETCFCIGEGKNYEYLLKLNEELAFFRVIVPLPHPRFVMQYKRKKLDEYLNLYLERLKS